MQQKDFKHMFNLRRFKGRSLFEKFILVIFWIVFLFFASYLYQALSWFILTVLFL